MTSMGVGSRTLLSEASFQGHLDSVTGLLQAGADHLEVDASGRSALHWAIAQHRSEVVKQLLEHHRRVGPAVPRVLHTLTYPEIKQLASKARPGLTPVELAAQVNDTSIFKLLLEDLEPFADATTGFNGIWAPNPTTPVSHLEDYDGSGYLAKYYKLSNSTFPRGSGQEKGIGWMEKRMGFLLHLAIKDDKFAVADMLLRLGANIQTSYDTAGGLEPLHVAVWYRQCPVYTQLLLDHGADPTAAIPHGYHTPLSLAVNVRSDELIAVLLEGGAYANANQQIRDDILFTICSMPDLKDDPDVDPTFPLRTLRTFLSAWANVNTTSFGRSLPYIVAKEWNAPVFSELIAWGADATWGDDECGSVIEHLSIGNHWDPEVYHKALDSLTSAFGSRAELRSALLSRPRIRCDILLDLGMDLDEPIEAGFLRKEVDSQAIYLEVRHLEVIMESSHSVSGWSTRCTFIQALTEGLLFRQKDDAPVESFMSILRMLDHADAIRPDQATIALFQIIKEYMGDKVEALVEALLDAGADIHHPNSPVRNVGWKPYSEGAFDILSLSAIYGREGVVSYLLRRHESQPGMFAASAHSQHGIRLTTKKALKRLGGLADPPRDWFCRETFQAMRVLHNSDADAVLACLNNVTSVLRQAPLHSTENPLTIAIQRGDAEAVRKLLLLGVDVHTKDKSLCRLNPLHKAIDKGHEPIVRLLLQANASVKTRMQAMPLLHGAVGDQFNYSNATALHLAVWKGDPSIVQALLEHGANIHARTGSDKAEAPCNEGQRVTPLEIALCLDLSGPRRLHPDRLVIASTLLERGAIFTAFIARQWKRLKLNEVLEMFSGHEILWDTFVAGGWDAVDYEMQQGNQ